MVSRNSISTATGLSDRKIRTSIKRLEIDQQIVVKSTNKYSIVTICNYDRYQAVEDIERPTNVQQTDQQTTNKRPTNKQERKNKLDINIINNNADNEFIDNIYNLYPSRCPKRGASLGKSYKDKELIRKLMKKYTKEQIEAGVKKEIQEKYGIQYMRNFSTFLNNFPDPNDLFFNAPPAAANNNDIILQKMYQTLTPEKEAEIYGLDPYEFSMLSESSKKMYRTNYKDKLLEWFKDTQ